MILTDSQRAGYIHEMAQAAIETPSKKDWAIDFGAHHHLHRQQNHQSIENTPEKKTLSSIRPLTAGLEKGDWAGIGGLESRRKRKHNLSFLTDFKFEKVLIQ